MEYGVQVTNKFKFLSDDEEDPFEALAKAEQAKKDLPKPTKKDKKAAAAVPAKPIAPEPVKQEPAKKEPRHANKENEGRGPRGRGGAKGDRGGRVGFAERRDAENRQDGNQGSFADRFGESRTRPRIGFAGRGRGRGFGGDRPPRRDDGGFRSGGEGEENRDENFRGGRGGGGRGFRGGPRRGFGARGGGGARHPEGDRHSGSDKTGIRSVPKREGFGKGNWGTDNDELTAETEPVAPISDTDEKREGEQVVDESAVEGAEGEKKEEEEKIKELTLDEWKKLHEKKEEKNFNIRKAGEGQDQKIYSKLVPLKKEEEQKEEEEVVIVRREPREKPLNIEVNFNTDTGHSRGRGGGFRGGRDRDDFRGDRDDFRGGRGEFRGGRGDRGGGPRGGRGQGGGRGGRGGRTENFALNDEAFPALGKA